MNMIPKAVRLKHQGENPVPNYGSNLRTMIWILVSKVVPPPRTNHSRVYKLVTMVIPCSVFFPMLELFKFPCSLGCLQLAAVRDTHQVSRLRGSMLKWFGGKKREYKSTDLERLSYSWKATVGLMKLQDGVFGRQQKASSSLQKLSFHPRSSYGAFEVFGNELPLQPGHPSYCILSIWLHHSSATNSVILLGQPDIWLPFDA